MTNYHHLILSAKKFTFLCLISFATAISAALFLGCSEDKPNEPKVPPSPDIQIFTIAPNDIVPPDSALVTWKTKSADSVKIFPSGQKLLPDDSGQTYVKPTIPTLFSLVAYGGGKKDSSAVSVVMTALAASLNIFTIEPDTLVDGDSSVITWKSNQADSVVINQGIGKLNPTDSGQMTFYPSNNLNYRAVAYSIYGNDTVFISVRVKKPVLVRTSGGIPYYKGLMGSSSLTPALIFSAADAGGNSIDNLWINLRLLEGDGTLIPTDSVLTNAMGLGNVAYNFSGQLGHAVVSANFRDIDTLDVYLRANTLIPGVGGQGQYILFSELYFDVKNFNGNPAAEVEDPFRWLCYADYEATHDAVFVIQDTNHTGFPEETEHVWSIILTSGYPYKTSDSIGIGSTYNEIKAVYGSPDTVIYDPQLPPALVFFYDSVGMVFFTDSVTGSPVDTNESVFEIHMDDMIAKKAPKLTIEKSNALSIGEQLSFRRYRR